MENQENNIIGRYLKGECSEAEIQQVKSWITASDENLKLFNDYKRIWLESEKLSPMFLSIDIESELEKFLSQIKTDDSEINETVSIDLEPDVRGVWMISLLKYAAVILIILGFGTIGYFIFKNRNINDLYTEITVPFGSKSQISLPDGTVVWLNAGSKLRYEKNFNKETREVHLTGEGYFIVAKDPSRPFLVSASGLAIRAIGTEFNVKCYPGEGTVETTLIEGAVKVSEVSKQKEETTDVMLKPNQKLTFIKKTGKLFLSDELKKSVDTSSVSSMTDEAIAKERKEQVIVKTIDPLPVISWREDKLILTGERFEEVKVKLERWYDVQIEITDPEILELQFKGTFQKESVGQALDALRMAAPFHYKIDKKHIIITK